MYLECVTFLTSTIAAAITTTKSNNRVTISSVAPLLFILLQLVTIELLFAGVSLASTEELPRPQFRHTSNSKVFLNEWAVHIPGGLDVAQQVANNHGYLIERSVSKKEIILKLYVM